MTTLRSTSHATRTPLASSAQLGPPLSVEPTVRPGPIRQVAVKRGRDAAARLPNNPETGCKSRDRKDHPLATVGLPSSRSLATASREAVVSLGGRAGCVALRIDEDLGVGVGVG